MIPTLVNCSARLRKAILLTTTSIVFATFSHQVVAAKAQTIEFRFNPPDMLNYTEQQKMTCASTVQGAFLTTSTKETLRNCSLKKVDSGYLLTKNTTSIKRTGVNNEAFDLLDKFFKKSALRYHLDQKGKCLSIDGFDTFLPLMKNEISQQKMPQEQIETFDTFIKGGVEPAQKDWHNRIERFVGLKIKPGYTFNGQGSELDGDFPTNYTCKVVGLVNRFNRQCVKIQYSGTSDPQKLKEKYEADLKLSDMKDAKIIKAEDTIKGEYYIDPNTMLVYFSTLKQVTKCSIETATTVQLDRVDTFWIDTTYDYETK